MDYDNELQGALFRNDKKSKETDRDFQGEVTVEGKEYWISSWVNENKARRLRSNNLTTINKQGTTTLQRQCPSAAAQNSKRDAKR